MKFFDKKGIGKKEIAGSVVLAIVAIIILSFFTDLNSFITGKSEAEICRSSVAVASYQIPSLFTVSTLLETPNPIAINCPKRELFVGKKAITGDVDIDFEDGCGDNDYCINEEKLKRIILDEMALCWWMFGEGSQKVYEASPKSGEDDVGTGGVCFKCAEIFLDSDQPVTMERFYNYAAITLRPSKKDTYMSYIAGMDSFSDIPDGTISLDKNAHSQWSVLFVINEVTGGAHILKKPDMPIVDCMSYDKAEPELKLKHAREPKKIPCGNDIQQDTLFHIKDDEKNFQEGIILGRNYPGGKNTFTRTRFYYPFTVRVIPTQNVFNKGQCNIVY